MTAPGTLQPIAPLVCIGWLAGVATLADVDVTQAPKDEASWSSDISIVVSVVPGSPDPYTPLRSTVFQLDVLGKAGTDSRRPPLNRCYETAERVMAACDASYARRVVLPGDYKAVRVTDVARDREPYRLPNDPTGWARVVTQIRITYVVDE